MDPELREYLDKLSENLLKMHEETRSALKTLIQGQTKKLEELSDLKSDVKELEATQDNIAVDLTPAEETTNIIPDLAASVASVKLLKRDATGIAGRTPTSCSTDGCNHNAGGDDPMAACQAAWSTCPSFTVLPGVSPTPSSEPALSLALGALAHTKYSTEGSKVSFNSIVPVSMSGAAGSAPVTTLYTAASSQGVIPTVAVTTPHTNYSGLGQELRPLPWPSFDCSHFAMHLKHLWQLRQSTCVMAHFVDYLHSLRNSWWYLPSVQLKQFPSEKVDYWIPMVTKDTSVPGQQSMRLMDVRLKLLWLSISCKCQAVHVWSELLHGELTEEYYSSVTNSGSLVTISVGDLDSLEFIEPQFLVIHEQVRDLAGCFGLENLWHARDFLYENQDQSNFYEHHLLKHSAACSTPTPCKLHETMQILSMSDHWQIWSQEDFKGICGAFTSIHLGNSEDSSEQSGALLVLRTSLTVKHNDSLQLLSSSTELPCTVVNSQIFPELRLLWFELPGMGRCWIYVQLIGAHLNIGVIKLMQPCMIQFLAARADCSTISEYITVQLFSYRLPTGWPSELIFTEVSVYAPLRNANQLLGAYISIWQWRNSVKLCLFSEMWLACKPAMVAISVNQLYGEKILFYQGQDLYAALDKTEKSSWLPPVPKSFMSSASKFQTLHKIVKSRELPWVCQYWKQLIGPWSRWQILLLKHPPKWQITTRKMYYWGSRRNKSQQVFRVYIIASYKNLSWTSKARPQVVTTVFILVPMGWTIPCDPGGCTSELCSSQKWWTVPMNCSELFQWPLTLGICTSDRGWSMGHAWGQAEFQGGRSVRSCSSPRKDSCFDHAFYYSDQVHVDHHYYLDTSLEQVPSGYDYYIKDAFSFDPVQVDLNHDYYCNDYHGDFGMMKDLQAPWDPGKLCMATAWGQAVFQEGRGVSDRFHCAAQWQTKAQPTTLHYIYTREQNEQASWLGSGELAAAGCNLYLLPLPLNFFSSTCS